MSFWLSSFTKRWHTHPLLSTTSDPVSGHQCRVTLIMLQLDNGASRNAIIRAITHDQGEAAAGDIPYGFKRAHPEVSEKFAAFEDAEIADQGFDVPILTNYETKLFKLCDWTDAYLWARKHEQELVDNHPAWSNQLIEMIEVAKEIGVETRFVNILKQNAKWHN